MVTKVYDFQKDGQKYRYTYEAEDFEVVLGNGETIRCSTLMPYDPLLIRELGLTNFEKVLEYFMKVRHDSNTRRDLWVEYFDRSNPWGDGINTLRYARYEDSSASLQFFPRSRIRSDWKLCGQTEATPNTRLEIENVSRSCQGHMYFNVRNAPTEVTFDLPDYWKDEHNYSYQMDPDTFNFFRTTDRDKGDTLMFGLELEVSTKICNEELQYIVTEVEPKQEPFFITKDDSSITRSMDYGYEIVTVPCTPRYLKQEFKILFDKIEKLVNDKGKSIEDYFDTAIDLNNGIHIHVGKDAFEYEQGGGLHARKFLAAWNQWDSSTKALLQEMSRRKSDYSHHQYTPIDNGYLGKTLARRLHKRLAPHSEGRSVCHGRKSQTYEVRLFQGIFDITHVLSCIEAVEAMYYFTRDIGFKSFGRSFRSSFEKYIINTPRRYRNLKETLKCA